jgi:hypothetical protein
MTFKRNRRYATFVQDLSEFNEYCEERDAEISAAEKDAMDLIERLRDVSELEDIDHDICDTAREAAREIEELCDVLRDEGIRLRDVIRRVRAEAENKRLHREATDNRLAAYAVGKIDGLRTYAWWKDGTEYVGCGNYTLEQAIHEVKMANALAMGERKER